MTPPRTLSSLFGLLLVTSLFAEVSFVSPEHEAADHDYRNRITQIEDSYQERTGKLVESYAGALKRLQVEMQRRGVAAGVATIQGELDRLATGDTSGFPEGEFLADKVKALRKAFDDFNRKLGTDASNADAIALYQYDTRLGALLTEMQQAGATENSSKLSEFRTALLNPVIKANNPPEPHDGEQGQPIEFSSGGATDVAEGTVDSPPANDRKRPKRNRKFQRPTAPTQDPANPSGGSAERFQNLIASMPRPMTRDEYASQSATMGATPQAGSDGSYPLLVQGMSRLNELSPAQISAWGNPVPEMIGDTGYWSIQMNFTVKTMFGVWDTEGKALVRGGRVERWIYSGTGEPIN